MSRDRLPSLAEHRDDPFARLAPEDREFIAQIFRGLDDRIRLLEQRHGSTPPEGTTEVVRTSSGYRVRAPWWVAITLSIVVLAIVAVWRAKDLALIVR